MFDYLNRNESYKVIKMTTGPRVLDILLSADILDELFITRVDRGIEADSADTQTILHNKKVDNLPGFRYEEMFRQSGVRASDGMVISQTFGVYKKGNI